MPGGRDKFKPSGHYCKTPILKSVGKVWVCNCGAVYSCRDIKGRLHWLQTKNGRQK